MSKTKFVGKYGCLKLPLLAVVFLLLLKIIWVSVFHINGRALIDNQARTQLLTRRAYLISQTYDTAVGPDQMPSYLPPTFKGEWAAVSYSMTALALANIAFTYPETQEESLTVVAALIEQMLTPEFRYFDTLHWGEDPLASLGDNHGHIGYLGHLNLMLAAYHYLGGDDEEYRHLFHEVTLHLHESLLASPFLNAETYPHEIYVPDNAAVIASLALYDNLYPHRATGISPLWVDYARENFSDPQTGLLVFRLSTNGTVTQYSRGSGAGWSSFYLFYADSAFAQEQALLLKNQLKKQLFPGIVGVSEWPDGQGFGDIDSGPLFFGLSPSGTGFSVAGAKFTEDAPFLTSLLLTTELAGFSFQWQGQRQYLTAPLVGDAILLAMMSVTEWDGRYLDSIAAFE